MRLLNCHVDNFGVLSGYSHTFTDGLNVIKQENAAATLRTHLMLLHKTAYGDTPRAATFTAQGYLCGFRHCLLHTLASSFFGST